MDKISQLTNLQVVDKKRRYDDDDDDDVGILHLYFIACFITLERRRGCVFKALMGVSLAHFNL